MPTDRAEKSNLLRDYLDGALAPERVAEAEQLIESDPHARTLIDEQDKIETFIHRLQEALAMPSFPAEQNDRVTDAMRQAVAEQTPQPMNADDTAAANPHGPAVAIDSESQLDEGAALAFLSPPQGPNELGRLNGYRVLKKLGAGGMGIVFEAEDIKLKRRVALKVMKPEIAAKEQHRVRFLREAQTAAAVESDHICPIFQVGEENGVPFIAMPFLKGEPLNARLKRGEPGVSAPGSLPIAEAVRIGREVAEGLAAAHDAGLVHRDIKPGNIWLESLPHSRNRCRILDFGLARSQGDDVNLTASGAVLGTPAYMAPEQARGRAVDHRADLFSLGVLLYEMTTGRRPFTGADTLSILTSLAIDEPTAPNLINAAVPADLSNLIVRLLAKSPDNRPANGRVVAEALLAILMRTSRPFVEAIPVGPRGAALPRGAYATPYADAVDATAVGPWGGIDESTASTPAAPSAPIESPVAEPLSRSRLSGMKVAIAAALLLTIGGGFTAYKLVFETKEGTLIVEVEGDADVRFKNGELQIYGEDGKLKYTLKAGERDKKMPPGKYTVLVISADGVKLNTDKFEMSKDGKVVLRVTADAIAVAKKEPKIDLTKDPDRRAAEWVLSIGGGITIMENGQERLIGAVADLPRGAFELMWVDLTNNQKVSDAGLAQFRDCRNLMRLYLGGLRWVSDTGLAYFKDCKNLTHLELHQTLVSDAGLAYFKDCKNLTHLELSTTNVSDAGLAHFENCKNLMHLNLSITKVNDAGLAHFKDCKNLRELYLGGSQVTDAGLIHFKDCKNLTYLNLVNTKVSDAGLAHFKDCKNLTILCLANTQVSDAGLAHFKECKNLTDLQFYNTLATDAGVAHFKACNKLTHLAMEGTKVGDAGLAHFKDCKDLTHLNLGTQVSDASIEVLSGLTKLNYLFATGSKLTPKGIEALARALPECKIEWDGGVIEPQISPDRKAAEWVLSIGGTIKIDENGKEREIKAAADLPPGAFRLTFLSLNSTKVGDAGLAHFKDCKNLTFLGLHGTQVGDAGLAHFRDYRSLTQLHLGATKVSDAGLANFKDCRNLTFLALGETQVSDAGIANFKDCKDLTQLHLSHTLVTDAGLTYFKDCKNLTVLLLGGPRSRVTDVGLANFKDCKNLTVLQLWKSQVSDAGLAVLNLTKLTTLDLRNTKVTAEGVKKLAAALPQCKIEWDGGVIEPQKSPDRKAAEWVLSVGGGISINENGKDRGIKAVGDLPQGAFEVRMVYLEANQKVSDAGLASFKDCKNLTHLNLGRTQVSDAGLAHFKDCKNLTDLALWETQVGDAGLAHFGNCKSLTFLALSGTKVSDAGLVCFKDCKSLTVLYLNGTQVGDAGLAHFKNCKNLTTLHLEGTQVGDPGLAPLEDCKNLTTLYLQETKVSDAGLAHIKDSKSLTNLYLKGTKVTAAGIDALKQALPKCQIVWDGGVIEPKALVRLTAEQRKVLDWVLAAGGEVYVVERGGGERGVRAGEQFPDQPFAVKNIFLRNKSLADATVDNLRALPPVQHGLMLEGSALTDAGLEKLTAFPGAAGIEYLQLKVCPVTGTGWAGAKRLVSLRTLGLDATKFSDAGLEQIKSLTNLRILLLSRTEVTDAGLVHLKGLTELVELRLDDTRVTEAGLPTLAGFRKLAVLDLSGLAIADEGLKRLAECKALTEVKLLNAKVTAEGVKKLAAALPNCRIVWDGGAIDPKK